MHRKDIYQTQTSQMVDSYADPRIYDVIYVHCNTIYFTMEQSVTFL